MTIKIIRNTRNGPGGGTRRLHHVYTVDTLRCSATLLVSIHGSFWGRNRLDVRHKGIIVVRGGFAVTELFTHANTNTHVMYRRREDEELLIANDTASCALPDVANDSIVVQMTVANAA